MAAQGDAGVRKVGHYSLIDEIGRGGQATVYLAEDSRLRRRVALKVLNEAASTAEETLGRFRREAELASKLDHPGICPVYDAGVEDGVPYIAMRLVEGETLARRIAKAAARAAPASASVDLESGVTLDAGEAVTSTSTAARPRLSRDEIAEAAAIVEKVARALHAAHEAGVIHRDIKPANVMITPDGDPVLLDLGLARDESADQETLTRTGDVFGTPAYMSPEQLTGQRIRADRRTDVYALGATLFEAVTLRRPFEAPTREGLYQAILTDPPADARKLNPRTPSELKVVMETALEKNRNRRYQTALALAEDLARIRKHEPITAKPPGPLLRLLRLVQRRPATAASITGLVVALGLLGYAIGAAGEANVHERLRNEAERERDRADAALAALERGRKDEAARLAITDLDTQLGCIIYGGDAILGQDGSIDLKPMCEQYLAAYAGIGLPLDEPGGSAASIAELDALRARDRATWTIVTHSFEMLRFGLEKAKVASAGPPRLRTALEEVGIVIARLVPDAWDRDLRAAQAELEKTGEDRFSRFLEEASLAKRTPSEIGQLGVILLDVPDRFEQGRTLIDRAIDLEPDSFWMRFMRGGLGFMAMREQQDPKAMDKARLDFAVASALRPKSGLARAMYAVALVFTGDYQAAFANMERATEIEPGSAFVWAIAAEFYAKSPSKNKAIEAARKALEIDPTIGRARAILKALGVEPPPRPETR
jgi:serine/threonine protein kinase